MKVETSEEREEERAELRKLCEQMLAFENHYLQHYRAYLLTQLRSTDEQAVRFAERRLCTMLYDDQEMVATLQEVENNLH